MREIDLSFSRSLLSQAHALVKANFPRINLKQGCWTYHFHRDNWEFHGPDKFYWHGRASNAFEARYKGWMAWLRHKGVNVDAEAA